MLPLCATCFFFFLPVEKTSLSIIAFKNTKTLVRDSKQFSKTPATPVASEAGQTSHNDKATSISDSINI